MNHHMNIAQTDGYTPGETFTISLPVEDKYAQDYLEEARDTLVERGKDYDTVDNGGERSMGKAIDMFNICTGAELMESEGWLLLQILKDVRQWTKEDFHEDSALDCISYAALKAEALYRGD